MAEPVTLYPVQGGDPIICAAPSEVRRLLESSEWALEPTPEKPKATSRAAATKDK